MCTSVWIATVCHVISLPTRGMSGKDGLNKLTSALCMYCFIDLLIAGEDRFDSIIEHEGGGCKISGPLNKFCCPDRTD